MKKVKMALLCFVASTMAQVHAQTTTQVVNISTGVDNTTGLLTSPGSSDDSWQVSSYGGSLTSVPVTNDQMFNGSIVITGPTAWPTTSAAHWLTPSSYINASHQALSTALAGTFIYELQFTAASNCTPNSATLNFTKIGCDNTLTGIKVNGHACSYTLNPSPTSFASGSVTVNTSYITPGTNKIDIYIYNALNSNNGNPTWTGFLVDGNMTIVYPALVPSFTAPSAVCYGDAITLNGSASAGAAADNVWTVVESDPAGNAVAGATEWWSSFFPGLPSTYTLPSAAAGGPVIQCDKYYRIKLALQNSCDPWEETFHVIHVNCLPPVGAGDDVTICNGDCALIGASGRTPGGVTYQWTGAGVLPPGTSKQINVCPTTTTTYTVTATNTSTGCTASDVVTVTVLNNDPSFSYTGSTTSPAYYTFTAHANDIYANTQPGFTFSWTLDELNTSGVSIYSDAGTDAWWTFPDEAFNGFDGTGTTDTQTPWGTPAPVAVGKFAYGHTYRFIRGTWNSACPEKKDTLIVTTPQHRNYTEGNNNESRDIIVYTGKDARDFVSHMAENNPAAALNVYPNPGSGIFNVELNTTDKTAMDVYDILGNKVKEAEIYGHYQLDLTGYSKGIYMIKMNVNGQQINQKIILE